MTPTYRWLTVTNYYANNWKMLQNKAESLYLIFSWKPFFKASGLCFSGRATTDCGCVGYIHPHSSKCWSPHVSSKIHVSPQFVITQSEMYQNTIWYKYWYSVLKYQVNQRTYKCSNTSIKTRVTYIFPNQVLLIVQLDTFQRRQSAKTAKTSNATKSSIE